MLYSDIKCHILLIAKLSLRMGSLNTDVHTRDWWGTWQSDFSDPKEHLSLRNFENSRKKGDVSFSYEFFASMASNFHKILEGKELLLTYI